MNATQASQNSFASTTESKQKKLKRKDVHRCDKHKHKQKILDTQVQKYQILTILRHEEPHKVPLLITLSDGCYAQFPVIILPPLSCRLAGVRLAVIDSDFHRGDETILNFATVW